MGYSFVRLHAALSVEVGPSAWPKQALVSSPHRTMRSVARCAPRTSVRAPMLRTMSHRVAPSNRVCFTEGRSFSTGAPVKVPAQLIGELRKRSEAGVMECKVRR